jgi:ubiquinone/menaquinone biosynthesis C-methylase UbiE
MSPDRPAPPCFDYDAGEIHRTYAAGRALSPAQVAFWTAVVRAELRAVPVGRAVDLGCGVGRFVRLLGEALGARVLGVDRSARMLEAAARDPALGGIPFVRAAA